MAKTTKPKTAKDVPYFAIRIVRETAIEDDNCPHCGARGKYVTYVLCSDGYVRGAMRGCLKGAFILPKELRHIQNIEEAMRKIKAKNGTEWKKGKVLLDNLEADIYRQAERYNATYGIIGLPAREHQYQPQPHPKSERTGECVEGIEVITGTILAIKVCETDFGYVRKMMVLDDRDFAVWGTMPSGLDANRGDRVEFSAMISKSNDDKTFGFYKRPTKAKLLQKAQVCEVA
jgi:hypothetical protein